MVCTLYPEGCRPSTAALSDASGFKATDKARQPWYVALCLGWHGIRKDV